MMPLKNFVEVTKMNRKKEKTNNALSLGRMIENTEENIKQAERSMEFAAEPEELENLEDKNARRRQAIYNMKEQKREEEAFERRKDSFLE